MCVGSKRLSVQWKRDEGVGLPEEDKRHHRFLLPTRMIVTGSVQR